MERARTPTRRWQEEDEDDASEEEEKKRGGWRRNLTKSELIVIAIFVSLPILVFLFGGRGAEAGVSSAQSEPFQSNDKKGISHTTNPVISQDKLLGGLLSPNFDPQTCKSRYEISKFRKPSPFPLSTYLTQKLRNYESYHKKCGPGSRLYKKAMKQLKSGRNHENSQCQYVVWFPCNGLGNRMLSLSATFLYALLTNRVLLTNMGKESENLFCEPFPGSSWVLPSDFPFNQPYNLHAGATESYVNMLNKGAFANNVNASALPAYVYLHLEQVSLKLQDNVFCEEDQKTLKKFNWMLLKSDSYFSSAFFLVPSFQDELNKMFPKKESVFHHLGRYLYHPTNQVWGSIKRYYESYLARADEKIGLQIRIFREKPIKFENMYEQVMQCTNKVKLLPETTQSKPLTSNSSNNPTRHTSILITSLYSGYYERIRAIYYDNPTLNGETVSVYQPSHEEEQQTEAQNHNQKALAEIYLLSFCDQTMITAWSTFGYVAHSFAGIKPWILMRPDWDKEIATVPCIKAESVEPCLHSPPLLECRGKDTDPSKLVRHVRHCEDVGFGIKLYDN